MSKTAAERQRERRHRKAKSQTVFRVPLNAGATADWLVAEGELEEWDTEDLDAIAAALARHLTRVTA